MVGIQKTTGTPYPVTGCLFAPNSYCLIYIVEIVFFSRYYRQHHNRLYSQMSLSMPTPAHKEHPIEMLTT
jgi:hypothetical protein